MGYRILGRLFIGVVVLGILFLLCLGANLLATTFPDTMPHVFAGLLLLCFAYLIGWLITVFLD